MGNKQDEILLNEIAKHASTNPGIAVKAHTSIKNSQTDRKIKATIQIGLLIIFGLSLMAYFYFIGSEATGKLLFFNINIINSINNYLYLGLFISASLLQKIFKYHFPEKGFWGKFFDIWFNKLDNFLNKNNRENKAFDMNERKDMENFY